MKKFLSLILVIMMFASLMSVSAMADDGTTIDFDGVGVTLTIPDSYFDTNGILAPTEGEELGYNTGWFYLDMGYVAMTQDEYEALLGQDELGAQGVEFARWGADAGAGVVLGQQLLKLLVVKARLLFPAEAIGLAVEQHDVSHGVLCGEKIN